MQKAELHSAEEQILRRVPIGGYVPEKALVEQARSSSRARSVRSRTTRLVRGPQQALSPLWEPKLGTCSLLVYALLRTTENSFGLLNICKWAIKTR